MQTTATQFSFMSVLKTVINHFHTRFGRKFVIFVPYIWLVLLFLIPFLIIFKISFAEMERGIPPYTNLFMWEDGKLLITISLNSYWVILEDSLDLYAYLQTAKFTALLALLIVCCKEYRYFKIVKKWHMKWKMLISFLLHFAVLFIAVRLFSHFNFSNNDTAVLFICALITTVLMAGFYYFSIKNGLLYKSNQHITLYFVVITAIFYFIAHSFSWIAPGQENWLNNSIDNALLNLNLINAPIMNIATDLSDSVYIDGYIQSLKVATISTFFCVLIGYPLAWAISKSAPSTRNILLLLIILPSWTSFLIRIYAWTTILRNNGLLNNFLLKLGIIDQPLIIMNTDLAVYIGIVYAYLPFVVLPIYNSLTKLDYSLIEAASDLGCKPLKTFFSVILPLTKNGVAAGAMLVFIPAVGEYVIPELLGGSNTNMIGRVLWEEFFKNRDWPVASAVASLMLIVLIVPILYFNKQQNGKVGG